MAASDDLASVRNAWKDVRKALDAFEAALGAAPSGAGEEAKPQGSPPSADGANEADLTAREGHLMSSIASIVETVTQRTNQIQSVYMSGTFAPWTTSPQQLIMEQIQTYQVAIAGLKALRPEAKALADAGHKAPSDLLEAHEADCEKALGIVQGMIGQNQAFQAQQNQIIADAGRSTTNTILAVTQGMRDTFDRANQKFSDYLRS